MQSRITKRISNLFSQRAHKFTDPNEETRFLQYTVLVLVGVVFMSIFGFYSYSVGRKILCVVLAISTVGLISGWSFLYRGLGLPYVYRFNALFFLGLLLYILFLGGNENSLALWILIFPLIAFFVMGRQEGLIATVFAWIALVCIFFGPLEIEALAGYSTPFAIRLLIIFSITIFITYTYENFRYDARIKLEETNLVLKKEIEEREKAEKSLAESEVRYRAIYLQAAEGILLVDTKGDIVECNPQILEMLGYLEEDLLGRNVFTLFHKDDLMLVPSQLDRLLQGEAILIERRLKSISGIYILCEQSGKRISDDLIILLYRDITERKLAEHALERANQALEKLAHMDGLTQVANRRKFDMTLEEEWRRLCRNNKKIGVILADIDYFKQYNDIYGHQAGDECLVQIATALSSMVHRPGDLVARYGGEEFVVLLPDTNREGCLAIAEKMRQSIENLQISHKGSECSDFITMSFGLAVETVEGGRSAVSLVGKADKALYLSKERGRNQIS